MKNAGVNKTMNEDNKIKPAKNCTDSKKPLFIVFEGLDGSGKSTQIKLLSKRMEEKCRRVYVTAEPTISATGGLIRDSLNGSFKRTSCELAGMFLADRIAHNASPINGIRKFLQDGSDVICDRYYYSSFAYQGTDEDSLKWVIESNLNCPEIIKPDLCIFLDADPISCQERMQGRAVLEIYEDSTEKLAQTRKKFFNVFERLKNIENIRIVNASNPAELVAEDVFKEVNSLLERA